MKAKLTSLVVGAVVGFSAHAQNLLVNGSLESPVIPSNTTQHITPTSWTWGSSVGLIFNGNLGGTWPLPQDGQQFVDIGNQSIYTLSQTVTLTNQGIYVFSWNDSSGHAGALTTSPYSAIVITGAVQTVRSNRFDAYQANVGVWGSRSLQLTLSPGTYTFRFQAQGVSNGLDSLIDNVSLVQVPDEDLVASIHVSAVDICWPGRTNQMYQVQYRTNLSGTNWFNLGSPVLGTGTNCTTDGINGIEQRYYRITRVP